MTHDRGAFNTVEVRRCVRGFLVTAGSPYSGNIGAQYAFDRIEDAAAWLVEQYGELHGPEEQQPVSVPVVP